MGRRNTSATQRLITLYEDVAALEKKAAFFNTRVSIMQGVIGRTEDADKLAKFNEYLTNTKEMLNEVLDTYSETMLELNKLLDDM